MSHKADEDFALETVSVIIPLFNGEAWIQETLQSVLDQTRPPDEILIVDDGSTDDSIEIVKRHFPEIPVYSHEPRPHRTSRDEGFRRSTSSLVTFLDQDDILSPTHLERLAGILENSAKLSAVAAKTIPFTGEPPSFLFDDNLDWETEPLDPWALFPLCHIETPSQVMMRRDALLGAGAWGEQTLILADAELWLRIGSTGRMKWSLTRTLGRRIHPNADTSSLRRDALPRYTGHWKDMATKVASEYELINDPDISSGLTAASGLHQFVDAIHKGDTEGAAKGRDLLLAGLSSHQHPDFRESFLGFLIWLLTPITSLIVRERVLRCWKEVESSSMKDFLLTYSFVLHLIHRSFLLEAFRHRFKGWIHPSWTAVGVDSDGWAWRSGRIQFPPGLYRRGFYLTLEFPGWHDHHQLEIRDAEGVKSFQLHSGFWTLQVPDSLAGSLDFRCNSISEIPHDGRKRSFRILEALPATRSSVKELDCQVVEEEPLER